MEHLTKVECLLIGAAVVVFVQGFVAFIRMYTKKGLLAGGASALSALLFISFSKTSNQIQRNNTLPTHKRSSQ